MVISWFSLWLRYLEYVRVGGNSGRLPRKEITQHEITISNHSFNGHRNAIILKFWLWRKSAGVKSMVTSGFDKLLIFETSFSLKNFILMTKLHFLVTKGFLPLKKFCFKIFHWGLTCCFRSRGSRKSLSTVRVWVSMILLEIFS